MMIYTMIRPGEAWPVFFVIRWSVADPVEIALLYTRVALTPPVIPREAP